MLYSNWGFGVILANFTFFKLINKFVRMWLRYRIGFLRLLLSNRLKNILFFLKTPIISKLLMQQKRKISDLTLVTISLIFTFWFYLRNSSTNHRFGRVMDINIIKIHLSIDFFTILL